MRAEQTTTPTEKLAEAIRQACLEAALTAYETARADGLCLEGAWECAIDAMRALDLEEFVKQTGAGVSDR